MARARHVTFRVTLTDAGGGDPAPRVSAAASIEGATIVSVTRTDASAIDLVIGCDAETVAEDVAAALADLEGVTLAAMEDDVLRAHEGGKVSVEVTRSVSDADDLALVYTPGVARVCRMIADDPTVASPLTIRGNAVAVVTDGSAVLGLGDIGPLAALPVMEGKAMLFKAFAGVDAYPILVDERDPDAFVDAVAKVTVGFAGINLEDIAAPRCFEIEGKLRQRLDIPVFHDDQHGTAIVVLAALMNAARVVGRDLSDLRVVIQGVGAAGVAIATLLAAAGVADIVPVDVDGIVEPRRRAGLDPVRRRLARQTNPRQLSGGKEVALAGADVFIGVSGPDSLPLELLRTMSDDRIVFAMANPAPEIDPDLARPHVRVMATGRSDHPNQINNVLAFPGLFRGLLDAAATTVTDEMEVAAARGLASIVGDDVAPDRIVPSPFDPRVVPAVAEAVAATARAQGLVRPGSDGSRRVEASRALAAAAERAAARSRARARMVVSDATGS